MLHAKKARTQYTTSSSRKEFYRLLHESDCRVWAKKESMSWVSKWKCAIWVQWIALREKRSYACKTETCFFEHSVVEQEWILQKIFIYSWFEKPYDDGICIQWIHTFPDLCHNVLQSICCNVVTNFS